MARKREMGVFGLDHDYSAMGSFEVEVQLRKGQEVKKNLNDIWQGIKSGSFVDPDVEVDITISPNLNLFIIPRFPIDRRLPDSEAPTDTTDEPFIIKEAKVRVDSDEDEEPVLLMAGELAEPEPQAWIYEFDPLAGHEIIAIANNGDYQLGGIRVASDAGKLMVEVY